MTNTNCLADMRCPRCGSEGPFDISAGALFTVADSGVEAYYGVEWNNDASCYCRQCQHDSIVNDFMIEHQTDTGPDVVSALLKAAREALQALERVSDALHYEDGEPVTFLESREIEQAYHDALSPIVELSSAIEKAEAWL